MSTSLHLTLDDRSIPTGLVEPYPGIEADKTFVLGAEQPDIDHCFIVNTNIGSIPIDTRILPVNKLATFYHPKSSVHLEVYSTEPAFQFYTGKYIDLPAVEGSPARGSRSGFCIEPSRYINAVNEDKWRGMVVLKRDQLYGSSLMYRAWKDEQ